MDRDQAPDLPAGPEPNALLLPLTVLRTETALSRFPVHRIAKRGEVRIELKNQAAAVLWKVSHNSEYGQPGPLAYKLDTLVINRKIEEQGKPVPKFLRLGSLNDICRELHHAADGAGEDEDPALAVAGEAAGEGGQSAAGAGGVKKKPKDPVGGKQKADVRTALLQNASAFVTAKISFVRSDRSERFLEAAFTRYSVVFTGETLPDGRRADAVYLILNDIYQEVLNEAQTRPLDYEYMRALPPAAQRFYEIVSYQIYAALLHRNPRARLSYSEYCTLSTQTRYGDWDHVKKQMYKIHLPHLRSGYLAKVEYEATTDGDGQPDWNMLYTPGPNAAAEFRAFKGGGNRAVQKLGEKTRPPAAAAAAPATSEVLMLPFPVAAAPAARVPAAAFPEAEPALDPDTAALVAALREHGIGGKVALGLARDEPDKCRLYVGEYLPFWEAEVVAGTFAFKKGKGAFLTDAIRNDYGPPPSYEVARRAEAIRRQKEDEAARANARKTLQEARRDVLVAEGVSWIARLEKEAPEAFSAFSAQLEEELQSMLRRFKSERAQETYRRLYASDAKRVALLGDHFVHADCPLPELAAWLGKHEQELRALLTGG